VKQEVMGHKTHEYRFLVRKPEIKRPPGKIIRRWGHNIKIRVKEIVRKVVHWNHLTQNREEWRAFVNTAIKFLIQFSLDQRLKITNCH
jgi:hypothetical protein